MKKFMKAGIYSLTVIIIFLSGCKVTQYSHNESVKQDVMDKEADSVTVVAGKLYEAGKFKRFMLGDHYRDVWLTPVTVPVINLDKEKGGFEILKKGGGMQTYSLKLKAENGKLYSLRSIQKDPTKTLPFGLRYSFADDIVQDQISASLPYAPFVLPPLEDAIGMYHTNPELFYIPDTPELGKYRDDFGGAMAMLEQDADEDWSDYEDFGYTKNAVSTEKVMEELRDDNDNYVDEESLLKARLFDIWIGDWDRHEGQFRWAELEDDDGKTFYRPIPEDRDNMFFKFDGFIPWWASRKWALRKFQDFQPEIRDISGFNFNARYLDRRFLTELSEEDWMKMSQFMQKQLTDSLIEASIRQLPDTVFQMTGERIIKILKGRRDNLQKFAHDYYKVLAKEVDVVCSDQDDIIEVKRLENNNTVVNVWESGKNGKMKRRYYHREFKYGETQEIRIYGLKDDDYFYVSGENKKGVRVRIIGGEGEDTYQDYSKVAGLRRKTIYYDDEDEENDMEEGTEGKLKLSTDADDNMYDFEAYKYDYLGPSLYFGLNDDDGIFFGGGVVIKTQGFRKDPYATRHRIVANFAPKTSAWNFEYNGDFVKLLGDFGMNLDLRVNAPNYYTNFYGYGNDSESNSDDDDYYRVRYKDITFFPGLTLDVGEKSMVKFGPQYQFAEVQNDDNNYISEISSTLNQDLFTASHFAGFKFESDVRTTDDENKPEKGIRWRASTNWMAELNNDNSKFSMVESSLSVYYTVDIPMETTLAVRIGGSSITGEYDFYQAANIGGNAGLSRLGTVRGFARNRFTGHSSVYQNTEIRMRLLLLPFYYMPFEFGISGHIDQGRVWSDVPEESDKWHRGVGGGIWIAPLGRWVFTAVYTESDEDSRYNFNLGFLF